MSTHGPVALGAAPHLNGTTNGSISGDAAGGSRSSVGKQSPKMPPPQLLPAFSPMSGGPPLAQQLSVQLTPHPPPLTRKQSRSAPTSPMARPFGDLGPLSTITPIDIGSPSHGASPVSMPTPSLPPVPHMTPEARAQIRVSPETHLRQLRYSPEIPLKPLSPLPPRKAPPPQASSLVGVPAGSLQAQTIRAQPQPPQRGVTIPQPQPQTRTRRNRSRSGSDSRSRISSGSETETEVDSDSTFVPGRIRHQHSRSQPDLSAFRSRLVEGWADGVRREQLEERRLASVATTNVTNVANVVRRRSQGRKTPPMRPIPLSGGPVPPALAAFSLHGRQSPRQSTTSIPALTPIHAEASEYEQSYSPRSPMGGMTGSEDGDDDLESVDSLSSGSLTFSPKQRRGLLRQRSLQADKGVSRALGLTFEPTPTNSADEAPRRSIDIKAASIEARLRRSSLLSFRLLAIVPSMWGIAVLTHAFFTGAIWGDVWPWGVDWSREALERLVAGHNADEGIKMPIHRGDMIFAIAWACLTAHFCFCMTTGLTHRWRSYYSLASTVTRLVSFQCLCWPATYGTLWVLGSGRPLLCWVIIGVTTAVSRTVQMWVTSNVVDDDTVPPSDPGDITPGPFPRLSSPVRTTRRHVRGWRVITNNRKLRWDAVARKVGWKVGSMLLVTAAWLFWRLEGVERALQVQATHSVSLVN